MADDNVLFSYYRGGRSDSAQSQRDFEFPRKGSEYNWIFGYETGIIQSGIVLKISDLNRFNEALV